MTSIGVILLLTAVMYGAHEAFRRAPAWMLFLTFSFLPILLTPYWIAIHHGIGVFPWLKLYTIIISISWLTALRATDLGRRRGPVLGLMGLLILNIVEALSLDATGGHLSHWLVLLSGILMVITLPSVNGAGRFSNGSADEFLYPGMSRRWIIEYTVWNWTFLFLNYPVIAGQQIAVLGAALIVGLGQPERRLQARCITLAASLLLMATFPAIFVEGFDTSLWHTPQRELIASFLCIAVAVMSSMRWASGRQSVFHPVVRLNQEK